MALVRTHARRWFNAQKGERLVHAPMMHPAVLNGAVLHNSWEARPYPTPGPASYAYEGLTQQPQGALGRGGIAYAPYAVTQKPMMALGTQTIQGTGVGTGTFYLQPLYMPQPG